MTRLVQRLGLTRYEADEHYKRAIALYSASSPKVDDAIIEMAYAIDLLPNNSEYFAARGYFYLAEGMHREAQADFDESLRLYPYEMLAHYGRGVIAYREKDWDSAREHFAEAHRIDPERAETLYYLALVYHRRQENTMAAQLMEQAAAAFDKRGDAKNRRAAASWVKTMTDLAKKQG